MTKNEVEAMQYLYRNWRVVEGTMLSLGTRPETLDALFEKGYIAKTTVNNVPCIVITPAGATAKFVVTETTEPVEKPAEKLADEVAQNTSIDTSITEKDLVESSETVSEPDKVVDESKPSVKEVETITKVEDSAEESEKSAPAKATKKRTTKKKLENDEA